MTALFINFRCNKHENALWFTGKWQELFYSRVAGVITMTDGWRYMFNCPLGSVNLTADEYTCDPDKDWKFEAMQ
jgi:hypothetical protein